MQNDNNVPDNNLHKLGKSKAADLGNNAEESNNEDSGFEA